MSNDLDLTPEAECAALSAWNLSRYNVNAQDTVHPMFLAAFKLGFEARSTAAQPAPPLNRWYMNDNHTFVKLPNANDEAILKVMEAFDKMPYGMLCGSYPDKTPNSPPKPLHAGGREQRDQFYAMAVDWLDANPHLPTPTAASGDSTPPSASRPECSGDPSSCPENEGYGCCDRGDSIGAPRPEPEAAGQDLTFDDELGVHLWRGRATIKGLDESQWVLQELSRAKLFLAQYKGLLNVAQQTIESHKLLARVDAQFGLSDAPEPPPAASQQADREAE